MFFMLYFSNFASEMKEAFAINIEKWYACHRRYLPWRETKDAYRIWVSEIILQQTRVAQGTDYYLRFIQKFPDVRSLARATEDEVLRMWQGLGYYSRARNMHKAAKVVMENGGTFPSSYKDVRSLPGIGDYTAAAIMSFAYDAPYAVLDGNVFRVLSRTQGIDVPIDSIQGKKLFSALAQDFLDKASPALYNQAIMDFGALQCVPKGPDCSQCVLCDQCQAFREGTVDNLPVKAHRTKIRDRHLIYINIHNDTHLLLHKRLEGDIWQGLYEFPLVESDVSLPINMLMQQPVVKELLEQGGKLIQKKVGMKHQLSHQRLIVDYYELDCKQVPHNDYQVVPIADLDSYPLSRMMLLLLDL